MVPLLACLGVLILFVCTLPAVRDQQALERRYERLLEQTQRAEAHVEGLRLEMRRGPREAYLRIKATQELLHQGAGYIADRDRRLGR